MDDDIQAVLENLVQEIMYIENQIEAIKTMLTGSYLIESSSLRIAKEGRDN